MKKITVLSIALIVLIFLLVGCKNAEKEREDMIRQSFTDATILNEKSDFGGSGYGKCFLLKQATDADYVVTPYRLDDEKSEYYYFLYSDGYYVTSVFLKTSLYNVFGIKVGDKFGVVDQILTNEGYKKEKVEKNPPEWVGLHITYTKGYIHINFFVDEISDNSLIQVISIGASAPEYAGIVY